jgi:hypothetical protein
VPFRQAVLEMLDIQSRQGSSDPFGLVQRSRLRVLGRTAMVHLRWNQCDETFDDSWRTLTTIDGVVVGIIYPDILSELQFTRTLICLEVRDEPFWTETTIPYSLFETPPDNEEAWQAMDLVMGLALTPVPDHEGWFVRKGLIRWVKRHLFSHAEKIELTIL